MASIYFIISIIFFISAFTFTSNENDMFIKLIFIAATFAIASGIETVASKIENYIENDKHMMTKLNGEDIKDKDSKDE